MTPPPPKFKKQVHHVVPKGWQRRFFAMNAATGVRDKVGYYRDVEAGRNYGPEGPGDKMAEDYAYIVFDDHYRPSDDLEDRIAALESSVLPALDRIASSGRIEPFDRVDVARLLGLQAARYPESFARRLDMARYLAIALGEAARFPGATAFNNWLQESGLLPGASFSQDDFAALTSSASDRRADTVDALLQAHGYEAFFNPSLVLSAAEPIAHHIAALEWELLESTTSAFILSDRPLPTQNLGYDFTVTLCDRLALRVKKPSSPVPATSVVASVTAQQTHIDSVNAAMRLRARRWICGAGPWVHNP